MNAIQNKQLPFAIARALTETARDSVKPAIEKRIETAFDNPTPFTKKGVGWVGATKARLVATVLIKPIQADYLKLQETGGTRKPKGRALVIPSQIRLNKYGNIPRRKLQQLLQKPNVFSGRVGGVGGVWQRMKGGKLKLLARYADSADYEPRFDFAKTAEARARVAFPQRFADSFRRAMATARR